MTIRVFIIGASLALLTACAGSKGLHDMSGEGGGPDAFSVLPTAPIERPADLRALPAPVPGAANRVDPTPVADAVVALGGRPGAGAAGDAALIAIATRGGVDPDIRATLAREDAAKRRGFGSGLFGGLFGGDRYFSLYAGQKLDAYAELARLRALGVRTPTAPPAP